VLTYRELSEVLARAGVEPYDPAGERFDPAWHEALQTRAAEGTEPGTVVEVLQKGYRLDGQVIRAARVVVSE
jgi:molecular chaperone GrpE